MGAAAWYVLALLAGLTFSSLPVAAQDGAGLRIEQLKVTTEDQFVTLRNMTGETQDLSAYELIYLNADHKPSKTFTFSGSFSAGATFVLSDGQITVCQLMQIESVSLGLSTTGGSLQLWRYDTTISKTLESSVSWVKTRKADTPITTVTLPAGVDSFLQRSDAVEPGGPEWLTVQPSADDPCQLESYTEQPQTPEQEGYSFLPSSLPPVRYVAAPSTGSKVSVNRNIGKMAPVVNEVLPNPDSPQTDADDEFIELYNPNESVFDLSGFKLAFGSTSPRTYTFPEGTTLAPKSFKAFTSGDTSISLSNSEAQVWLLAPNEQVIGESKAYRDAKDGQAWALAGGEWVWTAVPSPGAENTLSTAAGGTTAKPAAAVLGITNNETGGAAATTLASAARPSELNDAAPLHPLVLAAIGSLAVAYALYEYRHDVSNRIYQLRRYLRARRAVRP